MRQYYYSFSFYYYLPTTTSSFRNITPSSCIYNMYDLTVYHNNTIYSIPSRNPCFLPTRTTFRGRYTRNSFHYYITTIYYLTDTRRQCKNTYQSQHGKSHIQAYVFIILCIHYYITNFFLTSTASKNQICTE